RSSIRRRRSRSTPARCRSSRPTRSTRRRQRGQLRSSSDPGTPPSGGARVLSATTRTDQARRIVMPHTHASSDVGLKQSFASSSENQILTDIEGADRLGVSRFTVRSWRLKGVGPRFLKMGRAVRYRSRDVDEYERQALVETQAPSDHPVM